VHPNAHSNNQSCRNYLKTQRVWLERENTDSGVDLKAIRLFCVAPALAAMLAAGSAQAQEPASALQQLREGTAPSAQDGISVTDSVAMSQVSQVQISQDQVSQGQDPPPAATTTNGESSVPGAPKPDVSPSAPTNPAPANPDEGYGKQNKRILGIIPNYRAVSANVHLPPLTFKSALWLATQDTFDYSDFIFVGALAGVDMAGKSQPTFGQGAEGFGKYYWHVFVDGAIEDYMTEAIVPVATKEDPRYYTLGKGGFFKRTGYAVSRLVITRTNSGGSTFNLSEVVGAGAAAGIGNAYYPKQSNTWVKTYQRWGTQVGLDGVFNVVKEFWPDINHAIFRGKY
jgi:hypothetical protein